MNIPGKKLTRDASPNPAVARPSIRVMSRPAGVLCQTFLALAALVLLSPMLLGQLGQTGKVKGFKLPEFYTPVPGKVPPNRLKTLVKGAEAEPMSGDLVAVKQMQIESYEVDGTTNFLVKAPECTVDLARKQVLSPGALELLSGNGQLSLQGTQGFFCRLTNFNLIVSNHVRTVIYHETLQIKTP